MSIDISSMPGMFMILDVNILELFKKESYLEFEALSFVFLCTFLSASLSPTYK